MYTITLLWVSMAFAVVVAAVWCVYRNRKSEYTLASVVISGDLITDIEGDRTPFQSPSDLLTSLQPVSERVEAPTVTTARVVGRVVGASIRREMGYPRYTVANRVVAVQRIEAYRKEHLKDLRVGHYEAFVAHALFHVFTPSKVECEMHAALHRQHLKDRRELPYGSNDYSASRYFWWLPHCVQRWLGLAPFVGPDFQ